MSEIERSSLRIAAIADMIDELSMLPSLPTMVTIKFSPFRGWSLLTSLTTEGSSGLRALPNIGDGLMPYIEVH
jgi:hypothetical protein